MAYVTTIEEFIGTSKKGIDFYLETDKYEFCDDIWNIILEFNGWKEEKYNVARGLITKSSYENFFKDEFTKATQKKFEAHLDDDDEEFIEYFRVNVFNPTDNDYEFSSLWFFDIGLEKGYMPCFKSGINTSSYLAMFLCNEYDEFDSTQDVMTFGELLECSPNGSEKTKESIKNILLLGKKSRN